MLDVDLTDPQARDTRLRTGDVLRIPAVKTTYSNAVQLDGHVLRPAFVPVPQRLRLTDVIPSADELEAERGPCATS